MAQKPIGDGFNFSDTDFKYKKYGAVDKRLQDSLNEVQTRWTDLKNLLNQSDKMVTPANYNALVRGNFRLLSGNEIKNGKSTSAAGVIDEKSITINLSYKPMKNTEFYILPVISAEAEESFVNLFSHGKYARTVSYGSNFAVLLFGNSSEFSVENKKLLHNELRLDRSKYVDVTKGAEVKYFSDRVRDLEKAFDVTNGPIIKKYLEGDIVDANRKIVEPYRVAVDTLVSSGILPVYFKELNADDQMALAKVIAFQSRIADVVLKRFLDKNDAKQRAADFNSHNIRWLSGGFKVNHVGHDILAPGTEELTKKSIDSYLSGKIAFTWMWLFDKGHRLYFSLSGNYSNPAYYPKKGLKTGQVMGALQPVGTVPVQMIDKEITFYPERSNVRKDQFFFDLPIAYYNTKQSLGFEIGVKGGWNDTENDNLSVRLGPLIVLNPGAESQFVLQPIFKFSKLNQKDTEFWKDNFVFGANLSVSLPKGFFKK